MFENFISTYGAEIIMAVLTAIAGYIGIVIKNLYTKYVNDKTKEAVVKTVVQGIEQIYKDLHGEEKLTKALEVASGMLNEKNITISEFELRMMIEASVAEFNKAFEKTS